MNKRKQKKFLIGGIIIFLGIGYLGYTAFAGAATYYYTVGELMAQGSSVYGENVRVNGKVVPGSIERELAGSLLRFVVTDNETGIDLPVVFKGVVPDTFKDDSDVIIDGSLESNGVFKATNVMATCPSRYVPESEET